MPAQPVRWLNLVEGQSGEIGEKALKAVNRHWFVGLFGVRLALGRGGSLGGFHDGSTLRWRSGFIVIVE
jgi:hypothetical protein